MKQFADKVARLGTASTDLRPVAIGRATLAVCRAAYEQWTLRADANLTTYLDQALGLLATGFASRPRARTARS
jgi:TetR/AcrR family transcriptional regulator, regulator of mycofactocin system